jgi:pimeloyl-ACP methyl ester carboxylesterase
MVIIAVCFALVLAVILLVFFAGPRVSLEPDLKPIALPEDLDEYLKQSEAAFSDIVPGAEKTIIWANPEKTKTTLAVIYLHGYSATRQETAPLSEHIAKKLGANLFCTRLSGHGRGGAAMAEACANDWLNDSLEALAIGKRLGEKIIIISVSTGGTLAAWRSGPKARMSWLLS